MSSLQQLLDVWRAGLNSRVPKALYRFETIADRNADPEWETYMRLKEKFKGA